MKPSIGLVGGSGPLATLDIESKIFKAMQLKIDPLFDQDYYNLFVYNYTQFHDRNDAFCFQQCSPYKQYLNCASSLLKIGVDVIAFACHSAHIYLSDIKKLIDVPILDLIDASVEFVSKEYSEFSKIGLLATVATRKSNLYQNKFKKHQIEVVTLPEELEKKLMEAIYLIKSGEHSKNLSKLHLFNNIELINHPYKASLLKIDPPNPIESINSAIKFLVKQGCEAIILGCTELPLVESKIEMSDSKLTLIDPSTILANSLVSFSKKIYELKRIKNKKFFSICDD